MRVDPMNSLKRFKKTEKSRTLKLPLNKLNGKDNYKLQLGWLIIPEVLHL